MKLALERDALHGALSRVAKCVGKGSNMPILGNVLMRAEAESLTVVGTDLDIAASASVPARVDRAGALTVPARMMQDIISRSASGAQVAIEATEDGRSMTIRVGRSRIALQALPETDFPDLPADDLTHEFVVEAKALSRLLDKVDFAISTEETRFYLLGVFLHYHDGNLRAVATDGHRLARCDMPTPLGAEAMPGIIVPRKAVAEIIRIGKDAPGLARVALNMAKIVVDFEGDTRLVSKLIEGTFPDYQRVIPAGNSKRITLDREAIVEGTARLAAVAGDNSIMLGFSQDRLQMSVTNPTAGEAVDEMDVDYEGEDFSIRFAAGYLRDTLTAIDGDRFVAAFENAGSPAVFTPKGDDTSLLLVLMPRRV